MKDGKGFTLVELIIVMAIMGIMGTVAAFSWSKYTANANLRTATRDVASDFFVTRQKAAVEGVSYRITFNIGANNYTIEKGTVSGAPYAVTDTKSPASLAPGTVLQSANFGGIAVVHFQTRGTVDAGTVVLTNSRNSTGTITVNITGRTYAEFVTQ